MSDSLVYLDSSAIIKLIFEEDETDALVAFLRTRRTRVSSVLARIEVTRIVARAGDPLPAREAQRVLKALDLIRIDDDIVARAAALEPAGLRSLDAVHLATAQMLGHHLTGMVVYDRTLTAAAKAAGITTWSPR